MRLEAVGQTASATGSGNGSKGYRFSSACRQFCTTVTDPMPMRSGVMASKPRAIGRHVDTQDAGRQRGNLQRIAHAELRAGHNVGAPQRAEIARDPEDLAAVARPPARGSAALRHLHGLAGCGKALHPQLQAAAAVRRVRQPLAIRRDDAAHVAADGVRDRRLDLLVAASSSTMSCAVPVLNVLKTMVGRPATSPPGS